jgi:thioredoxin 1
MNKNIGIVTGIIIIVGIGFFTFSRETTEKVTLMESNSTDTPMISGEESIIEENILITRDDNISTESPETIVASGSFESYSAEKVALAATGDVVIFFHATWCPSCRTLSGDIEKNASTIPAGTIILKADYDTETELKKKYGVTTQHTLVQVDKDGNLIKKWSGGSKLANLLSEIQ